MAKSGKNAGKKSQLRIIGGQWRGRKLSFTAATGLRPTTDRIRETVFNWLAPYILDARCADLFAGSGALGLEALSRGAASCEFVDNAAATTAQIQANLSALQVLGRGRCHTRSASHFVASAEPAFDIVFIDPPFDSELVEPICAQLAQRELLAPMALIYIEMAASEASPHCPGNWSLHREKTAGGVTFRLYAAESTTGK